MHKIQNIFVDTSHEEEVEVPVIHGCYFHDRSPELVHDFDYILGQVVGVLKVISTPFVPVRQQSAEDLVSRGYEERTECMCQHNCLATPQALPEWLLRSPRLDPRPASPKASREVFGSIHTMAHASVLSRSPFYIIALSPSSSNF